MEGREVSDSIKVQIEFTDPQSGEVETSELEVSPGHYLYRIFRDAAVSSFTPSDVKNVKVTRSKK